MIRNLRITVLVENTVFCADLLAEHGLAYWIEADDCRILFDTGQGMVLDNNARQLGVDLQTADKVALSHGHFDHTGGLRDVLEPKKGPGLICRNGPEGASHKLNLVPFSAPGGLPEIYMHPAALAPKYARMKRPPHRSIGIPILDEQAIRRRAKEIHWTSAPTKLVPGVHLTGEVPRRNDFEDTGGPFFLDKNCTEPDPLLDDQSLFVETPAGVVVVLGCAHSGTVNTLDYIFELCGRRNIHAVLGGMHLVRAKPQRIEATADALDRYAAQLVAPIHCTGVGAVHYLRNRLGERCAQCSVGSTFTFGDDAASEAHLLQ